ncbi:MAG: helix-turn-helix domain-containing protein, partial [Acinetobacter baumannii]
TVQQNIIWSLLEDGFQIQNFIPICLQRNNLEPMLQQSMDQIERYLYQLKLEFEANQDGKDLALKSLINLIFLNVLRLSNAAPLRVKNCKNELSIFRKFNELIEDHFMEHWSLAQYASHLAITEARLNEICKRLADISSKKLIFDRQMQEAKRLLIFTDDSINEICYQLGFKDPAYFSRFFQRHAGIRPSDFRNQHIQQ